MNDLKLRTKGQVSPGHPVYGETTPSGDYRVDGSLTKGTPTGVPVKPTLPETIDGKHKVPQNRIPLEVPIEIPTSWLSPPIIGSEKKLSNPHVKQDLDADHKKD